MVLEILGNSDLFLVDNSDLLFNLRAVVLFQKSSGQNHMGIPIH